MPRKVVPDTCYAAVLAELKAMDAIGKPEGQSALALAKAIDTGRSLMAAPAMVKELRATLESLRENMPRAGDGVDEFAARRLARRAAAGA